MEKTLFYSVIFENVKQGILISLGGPWQLNILLLFSRDHDLKAPTGLDGRAMITKSGFEK